MSFINKYLRNLTPYKVASHKVWTVSPAERAEILKMDWNEAAIQPSPRVGERLKKLVDDGSFYNLYPSTYNQQLLTLLSQYLEIPVENIQYFASSDSLHEYIAKLYISVGDPVLLLGPTYDNFRLTAEVCGADIRYFNMDESLVFDRDAFIRTIDECEPSLVYICNPNNPTGTQHSVAFIQELLESYPQVLFLVDEAYAEFSGVSAKELALRYENILISRTMSKAFALANFRFGYLIASRENVAYISNIRNPKNVTTFTQEAVIGALEDIPYMRRYVEEVHRAAEQFQTDLAPYEQYIQVIRGGGNFALMRLANGDDKLPLIDHLTARNIYTRNVSQTDYLRNTCFRITVGTREQMKRISDAIGSYFQEKYDGKTGVI